MMRLWTNFAKTGSPGKSTNSIEWKKYLSIIIKRVSIILLKKEQVKNDIRINYIKFLSKSIILMIKRLNNLEKCVVIMLQMFTYVGNDDYNKYEPKIIESIATENSERFFKRMQAL